MERALFNGALSGLSREGTHYFYSNPLESRGQHQRWAWHICPCCTMNVARLVASVGGYFLSAERGWRRLPSLRRLRGERRHRRDEGRSARDERLSVVRRHPHRGRPGSAESAFDLKLRVPGWAKGATATVNGEPVPAARSRAAMRRSIGRWSKGDVVTLALPMPAERLYAHPNVRDGRRARGAKARSAHLLRRGGRQSRPARSRRSNCRAPRRSRRKSARTCSAAW